jgi:hypothetical protein
MLTYLWKVWRLSQRLLGTYIVDSVVTRANDDREECNKRR